MTRDQALAPLRARGMRAITSFIWLNIATIVPVGLLRSQSDTWVALALALAAAILPTWWTYQKRADRPARVAVGLTLSLFPMIFVFLFRGHAWQMDTHMYFFVCLSMMVLLCDPVPIVAGAGVTAVHHLILFLVAPDWVFPGSGSLARVLFHAFLVICEVAILFVAVRQIGNLTLRTQEARVEADQARLQAEAAHVGAVAALEASRRAELRAEQEHAERLAAEAALKSRSDDRRLATADEIEASIGALIGDLGQVAEQFNRQAQDIGSVSSVLAAEAGALRQSSRDAVTSIADMVCNAEGLNESIRFAGDNARTAQNVAATTAKSIATLSPGIARLSEEVDAARSILQLVSQIASQSNLLALNATIEAARSGEAGRGFSVVAAEMKQMALATARAADEISVKLHSIVSAAADFHGQIDAATARVGEITGSSSAIAEAVRQQGSATDAIARGAELVLGKVSETDERSHKLNDMASQNRGIAENASDLAAQLDNRARALSERMDDLLTQLRAA